ncbi:MAG: D-arabinono-1,4-lactone oxidase, partial [Acidimicrobiales bacterium]
MRRRGSNTWRNWAGNRLATPARIEHPASEADIVSMVQRAAEDGRVVRCFGAGHSFTDTAVTGGVMASLDRHAGLTAVDPATRQVTVAAGTPLARLNRALADHSLALPNLGDIDRQSIAGAVSTSTHGTGMRWRSIAASVEGFRLVTADGTVLACHSGADPGSLEHDCWRLGRVSLGSLGILSEITLQCVPAFNLHAVEKATGVDALIEALDDHVDGTDHFEFFWIPHTSIALTKHNRRTTDPPTGGRLRRRVEAELIENGAFGLLNRIGRRAPAMVPRLARAIPDTGVTDHVAPSHEVFCSPRRVRFVETEWAVPREALPAAFAAVRRLVDRLSHPVSFPVEVRFLGADDVALSTSVGRETAYVACHAYVGTPHDAFFAGIEAIMRHQSGRPHWGKLHRREATDLRT